MPISRAQTTNELRNAGVWAFDREHAPTRAEAIRTLNLAEARAQYRQRQDRVRWRGGIYWCTVAATAAATAAGLVWLSRVELVAAVAALAVAFAYVGRPKDRPAYRPAVVKTQYRRLTPELVEAAVLAAGLAKLDKEGRHPLRWVEPCQRDGAGWRAVLDLPAGVTVQQAIDARAQLASGLHVSVDQVWPERDRTSERRLRLWVADQPMSEVAMPAWPLLKAGRVDLFRGFPFGITARGDTAAMVLMFSNLLVGAIPRMGKTFAARLATFQRHSIRHVSCTSFLACRRSSSRRRPQDRRPTGRHERRYNASGRTAPPRQSRPASDRRAGLAGRQRPRAHRAGCQAPEREPRQPGRLRRRVPLPPRSRGSE